MRVRAATAEDRRRIEMLHARAAYGYKLPGANAVIGEQVVEEDGEILAYAGIEPTAQVVMAMDAELRGPHRRMEAMKLLHAPLAKAVLGSNAQEVYAFLDPQFHGFGGRMMKMGWGAKLWQCFFLERAEIAKVYGEK